MKEKVIYIAAFLLAFIFVSGTIIYVNTLFTNIFKFDFSPASQHVELAQAQKLQPQQSKKTATPENTPKVDSTKSGIQKIDSLVTHNEPVKLDTASTISLKDTNSIKKVQKIVDTQKAINKAADPQDQNTVTTLKEKTAKNDSSYTKWIKKTSKLYESMDAKKAAKIILDYSDNIARDLLLTMRKKKAAEILAEFKPDIAARIISLN